MTLKKMLRTRKAKKGQTALEYALVVGAISLLLMSAWNIVGDSVKDMIQGEIKGRIEDNIKKGNATIRR